MIAMAATVFLLLPEHADAADPQCEGHNLHPTPRPETSCQTILAKIHPSPDRKLQATVLPADISLDATPDMESRVVIRSVAGSTLNSHNHSSPRGANGYYVDQAQWSHPTMVYNVAANRFANLSAMIDGRPLLSE